MHPKKKMEALLFQKSFNKEERGHEVARTDDSKGP